MHDDRPPAAPRRVAVLGLTGAGKTTAAREIARLLGARHIEIDALYWDPGWTAVTPEVLRARLREAIAGADAWVTCGGYASHVWDITWAEADLIVWLDYPLPLVLARLVRRTTRRVRTREELWNGNRERLRHFVASRDSLLIWAVRMRRKYRRTYPGYMTRPELARARWLRFRRPAEFAAWVDALARSAGGSPSHV